MLLLFFFPFFCIKFKFGALNLFMFLSDKVNTSLCKMAFSHSFFKTEIIVRSSSRMKQAVRCEKRGLRLQARLDCWCFFFFNVWFPLQQQCNPKDAV